MVRGRRKHRGHVLVVPFGTGIGDMVNMRPLLEGIARAHPQDRVEVLSPPSLAWLLPPTVSPRHSVHGVRPWRRLPPSGALACLLSRLPVPAAGRLLAPLVSSRTARWMTAYLRLQEYPIVLNLLEMLTSAEGIERRWTPGAGGPEPRHVIDLLADALEERGIRIPRGERAPRLATAARRLPGRRTAIINPHSGSTLKEPPLRLWGAVVAELSRRDIRSYIATERGRPVDPLILSAAPSARALPATLPELVPFLAGAGAVVSPDTGILHLAAAAGIPYVGLFGPTDPRFCGPYPGGRGELVEAPIEHPPLCRHCWRAQLLPAARCPLFGPDSCLATVDPTVVVDAVERVIGPPV